jgi:acyl-CoA reductase-like NAD-dependent aldehyde dehydrogenase
VHNVISAVVAAIFAGNGCVCKVSELTCYSAEPLEQMFREILARRGHNPDLVQVITG